MPGVSIILPSSTFGSMIHKPPNTTNVHSMSTRYKVCVYKPKLLTAAIDHVPNV